MSGLVVAGVLVVAALVLMVLLARGNRVEEREEDPP